MKRDLTAIKNTFALLVREAFNKGALFILLVFISRFLGKEMLGRYSLALAISQIFFLGTDLGLNALLIRDVAKEKFLVAKFVANIRMLRFILGIVAMFFIWCTAFILGIKGEAANVIYLCGLSYFLVSVTTLYTSAFRAFEKMEWELAVAVIKNVIFLPIALWLLFNKFGLIAIFNTFLVSNAFALIIAIKIFVNKIEKIQWALDLHFLTSKLQQTLPLWVSQLFEVAFIRISPLLLFKLKGEGAVGLYNAGFVVVDVIFVIAGCFAASLFPLISRLVHKSWHEARKEYINGVKGIFLVFLPLAAILIVTARWLVPSLYGGQFIEIVPLFRLLVVASILVTLQMHNGFTIIATGKQYLLPFINGAGFLLNFVLLIIFIKKFSYMGAAYSLIVSEFLIFILMMSTLKKFLIKGS